MKDQQTIAQQNTEKKLVLGTLCVLIILFINGFVSYRATRLVIANNSRVQETQKIILQAESVLSIMKDAETGQRGYVITGSDSYLQPYNLAVTKVHSAIDALKKSLTGRTDQQSRMELAEAICNAKLAELAVVIDVRRTGGFEKAQKWVIEGRGKAEMDRLRDVVAEMSQAEQGELKERLEQMAASQRQMTLTFVVANLFACGFLFLFGFVILRDMKARRRAEKEVYEQRELLKTTLASIGDGVITTDATGRVTYLNPIAEELTA